MRWLLLIPPALLAGCTPQATTTGATAGAEVYTREAPAPVSDANVYTFSHEGPNRLGTTAVIARPTAGPDAAPSGSLAGPQGRAKAEAAAAFYAQNTICDGGAFRLAPDTASRYDAGTNSWTVFGRCVRA